MTIDGFTPRNVITPSPSQTMMAYAHHGKLMPYWAWSVSSV